MHRAFCGALSHLVLPAASFISTPSSLLRNSTLILQRRMATIIATANDIQKPDTDYRQYRAITLPNKMQALLIHDPKTERAAACLAVKVGSMFDPPQYQGIAHFLEHMLFLGTEKYPEEDSYNKYLAQNGGRSNAFTSDTNTVYFFTVNSGALDGALDRFSYFFKEPLFTQSATDREVQAVNSENSKNLQADVWRMMQLERELVFNKEHPSYHFGTGNKDTLKQIPREALLNFHNKWYSSNIMKLAVIGTESLDELQESVLEKFSPVENKDVYIPVDAQFGDASFLKEIERTLPNGITHVDHVAASARGLVSFVVPIKEIRQVDFAFFMPTQSPLWETKPARYLSHIFGHEGEGSLLSALKAQGLATGLSAGAVYDTAGLSVFKISIAIPNSAFQSAAMPMDVIRKISDNVARYAAVCRLQAASEGPEGYPPLWKEMRMVEEMQFRFQSLLDPTTAVQHSAISMHQPYPIEMVFSGGLLDEHWDKKEVQEHLDMINSKNMFLRIVGREFEDFCDQHEKWYGTTYGTASDEVKKDIFQSWTSTESDLTAAVQRATEDGMALPRRNPFIAERLDVKLEKEYPKEFWPAPDVLPGCGSNVRVFFKQDGRFHIPKTNVSLALFAPFALDSQRRALQVAAAALCRTEELNEMSYDAECAGLVYRLVGDPEGLRISVSGYDDKLELLLNRVCHRLRDDKPIDEAVFGRVKDRLLQGFRNTINQRPPYQHALELIRALTARPYHRLTTSLDIASEFTTADVNGVIKQMLSEGVVIEGLIEGNTREDEARAIVKEATDMFTVAGDGKQPITRRAIADLSQVEDGTVVDGHKEFIITRPGANKDERNGAVVMSLHLGWQKSPGSMSPQEDADDILLSCRGNVLSQILSQKFFDSLRTKQQLGYIVQSSLRIVEREVSMLFLVQSEVSVLGVQKRIEEFVRDIPEMLSSLTDEEYRDYARAVVDNLKETPKKQADEFNRHMVEISSRRFDFDRRPRLINTIETNPEIQDKQKMVDFARTAFATGSRVWARVTGSAESLPDELSDEEIDSIRDKHTWFLYTVGVRVELKDLAAFGRIQAPGFSVVCSWSPCDMPSPRIERYYSGYGSDSDTASEGKCLGAVEDSTAQDGKSALDTRTNEFTAIPTTPEEYLRLVRQQTKSGPKVVAVAKEDGTDDAAAPEVAVEELPDDRSLEVVGERLKSAELVQGVLECFEALRGHLAVMREDNDDGQIIGTAKFDESALDSESSTEAVSSLSASTVVEAIEILAQRHVPDDKAEAWLDWGFSLLAALDTPLLDCTMSSLQALKRRCVHLATSESTENVQCKSLILVIIIRGFFGQC
ncbi:hypothetical protein FOZ61_004217 [Perkinsus olseni]|uniref:Insulin-degrading enzyme n=1 Tax=Perkinsus olseni TaxID=32597 RepID=A0A7J6LM15_PEROL|nr:hypothetical protein FOZ61_004217 [Perkinsus olseni]